jgi:hypothetical protein
MDLDSHSKEESLMSSTMLSARTQTIVSNPNYQLVYRISDQLHPHPALQKIGSIVALDVTAMRESLPEKFTQNPICINQDNFVIGEFNTFQVARLKEAHEVLCLLFHLNTEEGLIWMLRHERRSFWLNAFQRVCLALQAEPWFKTQAKANQRDGGRLKGSSNLPEDRLIDVRVELAYIANSCPANISKVQKILRAGHPRLIEALRAGEIRINRGHKWSLLSWALQEERLRELRMMCHTQAAIRKMIKQHLPPESKANEGLRGLLSPLRKVAAEPSLANFQLQIYTVVLEIEAHLTSPSDLPPKDSTSGSWSSLVK